MNFLPIQFIKAIEETCHSSKGGYVDAYLSMDDCQRQLERKAYGMGRVLAQSSLECTVCHSSPSNNECLTKSYSNSKAQLKCHYCYKIFLHTKLVSPFNVFLQDFAHTPKIEFLVLYHKDLIRFIYF